MIIEIPLTDRDNITYNGFAYGNPRITRNFKQNEKELLDYNPENDFYMGGYPPAKSGIIGCVLEMTEEYIVVNVYDDYLMQSKSNSMLSKFTSGECVACPLYDTRPDGVCIIEFWEMPKNYKYKGEQL